MKQVVMTPKLYRSIAIKEHLYSKHFCWALGCALSVFLLSTDAFAVSDIENINPAAIKNIGRENERQLRLQEAQEAQQKPEAPPRQNFEFDPLRPSDVPAGGPCFNIKKTTLEDASGKLSVPPLTTSLNGQCADKKALSGLVEALNIYYQNAGYITTRVYLKPQNIKHGELILVAKAGELEGFRYAHGTAPDSRLTSAYPFETGEIITLRAMEQGLDNFNRPASQSGKTKLFPGAELGRSVIEMSARQEKPWRLDVGFNNSGVDSTGRGKGSLNFNYDNLFDLNDTLSLGFNQNVNNEDNKLSQGISFNYAVPYKNWLFQFNSCRYVYERILAGVNQDFRIDGDSRCYALSADYLLYRGRQARVYSTSELAFKKSRNRIEDIEIQSQRRNIRLFKLGLRGDYSFENSNFLDWALSVTTSVDAFGAMEDIPGFADSDFTYLRGKLNLYVPFAEKKFTYSTQLAFQHSSDELVGSEQFSAGGLSSVRGFHEESIYGNTGAYWRNQIAPKAHEAGNWKISPAIGLDAGVVESPASLDWSQPLVAGAFFSFGFEYLKKLTFSLTLAKALERPAELTADKEQFYFSLDYPF